MPEKEGRAQQLHVGLTQINLNLPARVCIPLDFKGVKTHQVSYCCVFTGVMLSCNSSNEHYICFLVSYLLRYTVSIQNTMFF